MTPCAEGAHLVCHSCFACQLRNQKLRNKVAYLPQQIQFRHRWNELVFIFHPCLVAGPNNSFQLFRQFLWDGCETENDISLPQRTQLNALMNQRLASAVDLQMQMKQAHWNVKGPSFIGLHELFDKVAEAVEGHVDQIAERIVQLCGVAEGTVRMAAARSRLTEYS